MARGQEDVVLQGAAVSCENCTLLEAELELQKRYSPQAIQLMELERRAKRAEELLESARAQSEGRRIHIEKLINRLEVVKRVLSEDE